MDLVEAIRLVAQRSGKHESADKTDITTAIVGAMEEIGTHIEVARAQNTKNLTIGAGEKEVLFSTDFQRILSVRYQYTFGADTLKYDLDKKSPSEFDRLTEGKQGVGTDDMQIFMVSGRHITIGPGVTKTGGLVIVRGQRQLSTNDIADLPNTMLVVHGAVANLLPDVNSDGTMNVAATNARRLFTAGLIPAGLAAIVVQQEYDSIRLSDQMLRDDAYRGNL